MKCTPALFPEHLLIRFFSCTEIILNTMRTERRDRSAIADQFQKYVTVLSSYPLPYEIFANLFVAKVRGQFLS